MVVVLQSVINRWHTASSTSSTLPPKKTRKVQHQEEEGEKKFNENKSSDNTHEAVSIFFSFVRSFVSACDNEECEKSTESGLEEEGVE